MFESAEDGDDRQDYQQDQHSSPCHAYDLEYPTHVKRSVSNAVAVPLRNASLFYRTCTILVVLPISAVDRIHDYSLYELQQKQRDYRRQINHAAQRGHEPPNRSDDRLGKIDNHSADLVPGRRVDKRQEAARQYRQRQDGEQRVDKAGDIVQCKDSDWL